MLTILLIVLLIVGVAGGAVWHPWVFLLAVVALIAIAVDHRHGRSRL